MLTKYLRAAMRDAKYEVTEEGGHYASIPGLEGVWADGVSLEECRDELEEVLEEADGSAGLITGFDCSFYRQAVYPFDLTSNITNGGASLPENALTPGYIVWTSDATDVANQTLIDTGAFQDILEFDANQCAGTCSSQVTLFWPATGFPSVAAIQAAGFLVLQWNPNGVELFNPNDGNHTFTVYSTSAPTVPALSESGLALLGILLVGLAVQSLLPRLGANPS
jgi:hypothetical protein